MVSRACSGCSRIQLVFSLGASLRQGDEEEVFLVGPHVSRPNCLVAGVRYTAILWLKLPRTKLLGLRWSFEASRVPTCELADALNSYLMFRDMLSVIIEQARLR